MELWIYALQTLAGKADTNLSYVSKVSCSVELLSNKKHKMWNLATEHKDMLISNHFW